MPTLDEAVRSGDLIRMGGDLRSYQQKMRRLYATPEVIEWMRDTLPSATADGFVMGAVRPLAQLSELANRFVSGADMVPPVPHPMKPDEFGIYRLRTDDVRLNGWFPERCAFIIGSAELKAICKSDPGRDDALRDEAIEARSRLNVCDGYFLTGDYRDHI